MTPIEIKDLRIKALEGKILWMEREREAREQITGINGYIQALDELDGVAKEGSNTQVESAD